MSIEQSLSTTVLTATEASGGVCPSYFGSRRQHQVPADWPSPILRFLAPATGPNGGPSPRPARLASMSRPFKPATRQHRHRGGGDSGPIAA